MTDTGGTAPLSILPVPPEVTGLAEQLSRELQLPLLPVGTDPKHCTCTSAVLLVEESGLALQLTGRGAPGPVRVDFGAAAMRHRRRSGHNELLGRAVGVGKKQGLRVIDGTAGLGRDSFVLADLGCFLTLCERNPVVGRLLEQGINRALLSDDSWLVSVAQRMQLHRGDARRLDIAEGDFDVIYLDPMFPRRNKSAAIKKDMAMFQFLLEGETGDDTALLAWALEQEVARVVVKRPPKVAALSDVTPSHSIQGKAVRYDVYVKRALA